MLRIYLTILLVLGLFPTLGWATQSNTKPQDTKPAQVKTAPTTTKHAVSRQKNNVAKVTKLKVTKHAQAAHRKSAAHAKTAHAKTSHHIKTKVAASKSNKTKHAHASSKLKNTKLAKAKSEPVDTVDNDDSPDSNSDNLSRIENRQLASFNNSNSIQENSMTTGLRLKTQELLKYAGRFLGAHYHFGGSSPETGFDCSGYVSYVYRNAAGIYLPHNAAAISRVGTRVSRDELRPGDLVFFRHFRQSVGHVGIYMGNDRFIHASSSATGYVQVSDLRERYWARTFQGARRLMSGADSFMR